MELWIATSNQGKLREFKSLLSSGPYSVKAAGELNYYTPPAETGTTFTENARIKAKALRSLKPDAWVVADDSGLEVEGLGGLPGIHSARYAGPKASDSENNAKLLKMLQIRSPKNRKARFICVLVAFSPQGEEFVIEGQVDGQISEKLRGQTGFGYDPVFIPEGEGSKTFAELEPGVKNKLSHRSQALKKLLEILPKDQ